VYRTTLAPASAGHWSRLASKDPVDPDSWEGGTGSRLPSASRRRLFGSIGRGSRPNRRGRHLARRAGAGAPQADPRLVQGGEQQRAGYGAAGGEQDTAPRTDLAHSTTEGDRYRARFRVSVCRPGTVPAWDSQPLWRMPAHLVDNSCHVSTTAAVWCGRVSGSLWSIGGGRWSCAGGAPVSPTVGSRSSASFHTDVPRFSPAAKAIHHFSTLSSARRL
jgi:hypothetical protein